MRAFPTSVTARGAGRRRVEELRRAAPISLFNPIPSPRPIFQPMTDSTKDSNKAAQVLQEKGAAAMHEVRIKGNQLVDKVRELIQEGNTRRVIIKKEGRTLLEFPLSVGVGGAAAALTFQPMLSAIGALAAHFADIDVAIERVPGAPTPPTGSGSGSGSGSATGASVGSTSAAIGTSSRSAGAGGSVNDPMKGGGM